MKMIIDANALIDCGEGVGKKFFSDAIKKQYDIYVPEEIYAEAGYASPSFHEIRALVYDLLKHGLYHPLKASPEDRADANELSKTCYDYFGFDLHSRKTQ